MAVVDVRVSFDAADWKSWRQSNDDSNPAQLRRMVSEWVELKDILSELASIDRDPRKAIGKLLAHHAIVERSSFVVSSTPVVPVSSATDTEDDFEDNTDDL